MMSDDAHAKEWLTVRETAERLNLSEDTVRRMIRAYQLPASRASGGARAPWLINRAALERRLESQAHRERMHEAGIVVGYADFPDNLQRAHSDVSVVSPDGQTTLAEHFYERLARLELLDRIEREMYSDPATRERLEALDEEARFEEEARELARRVRRAERLRDRALKILEEEDPE